LRHLYGVTLLVVALGFASPRPGLGAVSQAFRLTDLDLRDPHTFVSLIGCRDITDTPFSGFSFNGNLQSRIQADSEPDGKLDMSLILVFDPLDPQAAGGTLRFGSSSCSAPMGSTVCGPDPFESLSPMTALNAPSGPCLGVLPGTTSHSYSPSVIVASSPCFSTDAQTLTLDLAGIPLTLRSARIAATYSGSPAATLVNGLIRGFLTQADADNTIIPSFYPLVGGMPFSQLLPGGDPPGAGNTNCAAWSDQELGPDGLTPGWWMYFNFTAAAVPYTGPQLGVPSAVPSPITLSVAPSPFRSSVSIEYSLAREGEARVTVYDLLGRTVATLASNRQPAGRHRLSWHGDRADGTPAPPGLYAIRVSSDGQHSTRMLVRVQ